MSRMPRMLLPVALAALALVVPETGAAAVRLFATVGPGFTITLKNSGGTRVSRLKAGSYLLIVNDRSPNHDFHLVGPPSVDRHTGVNFVGTQRWKVSFMKGVRYSYRCDVHSSMKGSFTAV